MSKLIHRACVADHSIDPADCRESDGSPTWITRGANFVIAITRVRTGTVLRVKDVPDEHMVLLPDTGASICCGNQPSRRVASNHLLIVPPGDATVTADRDGWIVRCFSARMQALLALAGNASAYLMPRDDVAPIVDWPVPDEGYTLRIYDLARGVRENDKTRVYRSSNLMINVLCERQEPRDIRTMSPHSHMDFEQGSITLKGTHVHHLRTPWNSDLGTWRPDIAAEVGFPSVTVIPPGLIHTTRNIDTGPALLVDLFCPPRHDFAARPGMVRNADDYPAPETVAAKGC